MPSFNRVIIMGNLTRDPEVRYTPNGTAVCNMSIAVNRKYKQGEELKEDVGFFDIVVFGKQAEACGQYLGKGDSAQFDGRLQQRRWDDKDTGAKRSKVEIVAEQAIFINTKRSSGNATEKNQTNNTPDVGDGDIPF